MDDAKIVEEATPVVLMEEHAHQSAISCGEIMTKRPRRPPETPGILWRVASVVALAGCGLASPTDVKELEVEVARQDERLVALEDRTERAATDTSILARQVLSLRDSVGSLRAERASIEEDLSELGKLDTLGVEVIVPRPSHRGELPVDGRVVTATLEDTAVHVYEVDWSPGMRIELRADEDVILHVLHYRAGRVELLRSIDSDLGTFEDPGTSLDYDLSVFEDAEADAGPRLLAVAPYSWEWLLDQGDPSVRYSLAVLHFGAGKQALSPGGVVKAVKETPTPVAAWIRYLEEGGR